MLLLSLTARKFLRNRSMEYYAMLIASAAMLLIPFSLFVEFPKAVQIEIGRGTVAQTVLYSENTAEQTAAGGIGVDPAMLICAIWAVVAAIRIGKNIFCYIRLSREIKGECVPVWNMHMIRMCEQVHRQLHIRSHIRLMRCGALHSPILFGIVRPMLILPEREFAPEELRMVLTHELTHFKHKDIIVKQTALLASCLHWFNPASYMLCRMINRACELCCDESVLHTLALKDKKDYGRLLLSVIEPADTGIGAFSTSMAASEKHIKNRLIKIIEFKEATRMIKAVGILTAAALSMCSLTAFGFTQAAEIVPESLAPIFEAPTPEPAETEQPESTAVPADAAVDIPATEEPVPTETAAVEIAADAPAPTNSAPEYEEVVSEVPETPEAPEEPEEPEIYDFGSEEAPEEQMLDLDENTAVYDGIHLSKGKSLVVTPEFADSEYRAKLVIDSDTKVSISSTWYGYVKLYRDGALIGNQNGSIKFNAKTGETYEIVIPYEAAEYANDVKVHIYCK